MFPNDYIPRNSPGRVRSDRSVTRSAIDAPSARCLPQHCHQAARRRRSPTAPAGPAAANADSAAATGAPALVPVAARRYTASGGRQHTVHKTAAGPHMMKGMRRARLRLWLFSGTLFRMSSAFRTFCTYVNMNAGVLCMHTHTLAFTANQTTNTPTTLPICILRECAPNCYANIVRLPCRY